MTHVEKLKDELNYLLTIPTTSIDLINKTGWAFESNQGGTYFRHSETMAVFLIPHWIIQLRDAAANRADDNARAQIRHSLGLE